MNNHSKIISSNLDFANPNESRNNFAKFHLDKLVLALILLIYSSSSDDLLPGLTGTKNRILLPIMI